MIKEQKLGDDDDEKIGQEKKKRKRESVGVFTMCNLKMRIQLWSKIIMCVIMLIAN